MEDFIAKKLLEPMIRHIRFPFYKNLVENSRIDFQYPITAFVGQNGTNKSSVLRALYGSPDTYSLGNMWFSTNVDEIKDEGRSCFIYGYYDEVSQKTVEVLKTRILKKNDPDYWEPARPQKKYGMDPIDTSIESPNRIKTRWKAITKDVIYFDFRSKISAFDKCFYHLNFSKKNKKEHIRQRSKHLKKIIDKNLTSYKLFKGQKEKVKSNIQLTEPEVDIISAILGRKYDSIQLITHKLFTNVYAPTVVLKTPLLNYSEAFAGSGEFSVIMLVHEIFNAEKKSLILLDEPEISLHPGAQEKLMVFLMNETKKNKHQVVISTHSSHIISKLPQNAIKLFALNLDTGMTQIIQNISKEEVFYYTGEHIQLKNIYVEDKLAKRWVERALELKGEQFSSLFNVKVLPGGAESIIKNFVVPHSMEQKADVLYLLDGDKNTEKLPLGESNITDECLQNTINEALNMKITFPCSGNASSSINKEELHQYQRRFIKHVDKYLKYLPIDTPERYLINNLKGDYVNLADKIKNRKEIPVKELIKEICKLDIGKKEVNSDEIFATQVRMLAKLADDDQMLRDTLDIIEKVFS
jgi:predicted ATPase